MRPVVLSIAGSDPSGGAGAQADLKTLHQHGCYGAAALTLLTVQNTRGVQRISVLAPELVAAQVRAVVSDLPVAAVKTGALGSAEVVRAVAGELRGLSAPLVVDPVMLSSSGRALLDDDGVEALVEELVPLATVVTPNRAEASRATGLVDARAAARWLHDRGPVVALVTGGDLDGDPVDVIADARGARELRSRRVRTRHTHGTGCALSSSIAAWLARGRSPRAAVRLARRFVRRALRGAPGLGGGVGPLDLFAEVPD